MKTLSANAGQVQNGLARVRLKYAMKTSMRAFRRSLEVKLTRRRSLRARMENQISIWLSQEAAVDESKARQARSLFWERSVLAQVSRSAFDLFRRKPPVHGTGPKGALRVDLTRSPRRLAMTAPCAEGSSRIAAVEVAIGGIWAIRARVLPQDFRCNAEREMFMQRQNVMTRACLQLREERKGIGGGTFGVLARRGIPKSANV